MAIQVGSTTVISNTYQIQNITDMDAATETTVNAAVRNANNVLRIYDSAGTEIRTLFCAPAA